jgi:WD40 repeat protein
VRDAGHITALAALPNGDIASGNTLGIIWVMSLQVSDILVLEGPYMTAVSGLTPLPDGRLASSAGKNIRIWNHVSLDNKFRLGEYVSVLEGHTDDVTGLAVMPGRLASRSTDKTVRVWDINTGVCLLTLVHRDVIFNLAVFPDGRLATSSFDDVISVWDTKTGELLASMKIPGHYAEVLTVLPDGRLASAHNDFKLHVWE